MSINLDPREIHDKLVSVGLDWAKKKQIANLLDDCKSIEVNAMIRKYLDQKMSVSEATVRGKSDPGLVEYYQRLTMAKQEEDAAKVRYVAAQAWFDAMRSVASTERQEMAMTPSHR